MHNICFDKVMFFLAIIIVIVLIVYQYFYYRIGITQNNKNIDNNITCPVCPTCPTCPTCPIQKIDIKQVEIPLQPSINILREYDYRALSDPLIPPYKRDDYSVQLPIISTRGSPTSFKKIGILIDKDAINNDKYKFMLIMGRQKYPGSNYYDYYATENNTDSALKFDLPNLHKELSTDDILEIKELNKTYTIKIDRSLGLDYNPFY